LLHTSTKPAAISDSTAPMNVIFFRRSPNTSPIIRSGTRSRIHEPQAQPRNAPIA